jgi:hypothetical protein
MPFIGKVRESVKQALDTFAPRSQLRLINIEG